MMRRAFTLAAAILVGSSLPASAAPPRFHSERIDGRNYVPLAEFAGFYGFNKKWARDDKTITLKKKYATLILKLDSQEALIKREGENVRLWLNYNMVQEDGTLYIPEIDVVKTFDPVLRPWAVPEFKVRTIMIDAGHGGFDKGTDAATPGILEKNYTLDTARRLENHLKKAGFRTLMTRRRDEYVPLEERAEQANVSSADLFISIHYNSASPDRGPKGIETFCMTPAGASSSGKSDVSISDFQTNPGNVRDIHNMLLAYMVHQSIINNMDTTDRGVKRARFVVLKEIDKPGILIECGFLSNRGEEKRIRSPAYRETIAQNIASGIVKFVGHVNPRKTKGTGVKLRD
jgi:N-acetylmuramoyl-L-alanine amidase